MYDNRPPRAAARPAGATAFLALAVSIAVKADIGGHQLLVAPHAAATLASSARSMGAPTAPMPRPPDERPRSRLPRDLPPLGQPQGGRERAPRAASGALPDGATVFDAVYPGVANLDAGLHLALREATLTAATSGVAAYLASGWRAPEAQEQLRREAVAEYGSLQEASRWVAAPTTSAHAPGNAVDPGPAEAAAWLAENGAACGLCQFSGNEPWHYELRRDAASHGCPSIYADPTPDPGMQSQAKPQTRRVSSGVESRGDGRAAAFQHVPWVVPGEPV